MASDSKHLCHWPGCTVEVPPMLWGCKPHWFSLPRHLRDEIWRTYRRGQEVTKSPSAEYIAAAKAVQDWITALQASQRGQGHRPMRPTLESMAREARLEKDSELRDGAHGGSDAA